jgi:hypothetical protein
MALGSIWPALLSDQNQQAIRQLIMVDARAMMSPSVPEFGAMVLHAHAVRDKQRGQRSSYGFAGISLGGQALSTVLAPARYSARKQRVREHGTNATMGLNLYPTHS